MPVLEGSLGKWEVEHLHYWKDRGDLPRAETQPLFDQNTKIATIGSCFAENVVRVLYARGFNVARHRAGLWYNTYSIAQEFEHLFEDSPYEAETLWQTDAGLWIHPFKSYHRQFASKEDLITWSDEIDSGARALFVNAKLIVITLGLTEVWRSVATDNVFIQMPHPDIYRRGLARFQVSSSTENGANLERIYATLRKHTQAQLVLTVSPVPLYATFTDLDVRVANNISKSTLRAAVAEFVRRHPAVYYFHRYEIVASADQPRLFMEDDQRHIRREGAELIMDEFLRVYGKPALAVKPRDLAWLGHHPSNRKPKSPVSSLYERGRSWLRRKASRLSGKAL